MSRKVIAAKPTAKQREAYIANIISVWHSASARQMNEGRAWYSVANRLATMIGDGNTRLGAGVVAALSANKRWSTNVNLAISACKEGKASGHFSDAIKKADAILSGVAPESVLPMRRKTGQFYLCILDPKDAHSVVIDRHAHDVAVNQAYGDDNRGLGAQGRYDMLADCYREAARRLGELPQVVQAVTWTVWIERNHTED